MGASDDFEKTLIDRLEELRQGFIRTFPARADVRRDRLRRAAAMTLSFGDRFVAAAMLDFPSRPARLARMSEVLRPATSFDEAENNVEAWMQSATAMTCSASCHTICAIQ